MSEFDLPQEIANQINQNLEHQGAITLPFDVVYIWCENGDAQFEELKGVKYFGGWITKKDDADKFIADHGLSVLAGFTASTKRVKENPKLPIYESRFVLFAPIGYRESWAIGRSRFAEYTPGARHHVQMLVYLYEKSQPDPKQPSSYIPWGPAVLTGKGYQAGYLLRSLKTWENALEPIRSKVAPNTPPHFFLRGVGTFGKLPTFLPVGKGDETSDITPLDVFIPEKMDETSLAAWFVGPDMASVMADLAGQAKTWLAAWNTGSVAGTTADLSGQAANYDNPPEEPDMPF